MRIISGHFKGRNLFFAKDKNLRPTQDKIKEAVFNILGKKVEQADVLDLCCGTGSLGLEAFSRGAKKVCFVDKNIALLFKNFQLLDLVKNNDQINFFKSDISRFLKRNSSQFDLIFLDPPYQATEIYQVALNGIHDFDILKKDGLIICEHNRHVDVNIYIPESTSIKYQYGNTNITIFKL